MKKALLSVLFALLLIVHRGSLQGAPIRPEEVPGPLKPWADWVLHGHEDERCPFVYDQGDQHRCNWPTRLQLDLRDTTGSFTMDWLILVDGWAPLPGSSKHWPLQVVSDGEPILVAQRNGKPTVFLVAGRHQVTGVFQWQNLPEALKVPAETGLVELKIDDRRIDFPRLDADGVLWIREQATGEETRTGDDVEYLDARVYRRIVDDIPLKVITRIDLDVSGKPREVALGPVLLKGYIPLSLESPLPARVEPDGRLKIQVKPGQFTLLLVSRHDGPVTEIRLERAEGLWPKEEVWVFDARNDLRLVTIDGVATIDPRQTALPGDWQNLPAFQVKPGEVFRLIEKRRGDPDPAPDQLSLHRTLWLDFDGKGYTVQDRVTGTLNRGWRLEMNRPIELGRVLVNGQPQFITRMGDSDRAGVEVRQGQVQLIADSRINSRPPRVPAVGWYHDFHRVEGALNLPPGWRLLHATGIDQISNTWIGAWTLLDLFFVLIVALAVAKLWGWPWGILSLAALAMALHEPGAPKWIWVHVLAATALARALSPSRLRTVVRIYQAISLLGLVVITVPFLVVQTRQGLFPQLERRQPLMAREFDALSQKAELPPPITTSKEALVPAEKPALPTEESPLYQLRKAPSRAKQIDVSQLVQVDPRANIQTGPGLPGWQWKSYSMRWNGPVESTQEVHLLLLSPLTNRLITFGGAIILALLVMRVLGIRYARGNGFGFRGAMGGGNAVAAMLALTVLLFSLAAPIPAMADIPPPSLLEELRTRLLEKPDCLPDCAMSPRLRLEVWEHTLRARMEVHTHAHVALPLPGNARQWLPQTVLVNGEPTDSLCRAPDGHFWIALPGGLHHIQMEGPLPDRDTIQIDLPLKPHRVEASAEGWTIEGVHENGIADDHLQLRRVREGHGDGPRGTLEPGTLPPFVRVERTLFLGLTWQIETRVFRASPRGVAVVMEIPLIQGESVTTADIRAEGNRALINMPPDQSEVRWVSALDRRDQLTLRAPETTSWTEAWRLNISPIWHVEIEGIPVIHHQDQTGQWLPEWRPWPGEAITLHVTRPEGVPGKTLTVDHSRLLISPGLRATDTILALTMRSSQGGQHPITLPEHARLQSVRIDGKTQPIRQEGRLVTLPLRPASQNIEIQWRQPEGITGRFSTPPVDIDTESVNSQVEITMPGNRWVLFTGGPSLGPAVLFWPFVIVIVGVSLALARVAPTPLKTRHWILLGLGLTQTRIEMVILVVGWLLALGYRKRLRGDTQKALFDLVQVGLIVLSILAFVSLVLAIKQGLLGHPEMWIMGNGSSSRVLRWFQDRPGTMLPQAWVLSLPLFAYRIAMLGWALWLAAALICWLRWGWGCFSDNGLWRSLDLGRTVKRRKSQKDEPLELDVENGAPDAEKDPAKGN